jgi:hypothetical protein
VDSRGEDEHSLESAAKRRRVAADCYVTAEAVTHKQLKFLPFEELHGKSCRAEAQRYI